MLLSQFGIAFIAVLLMDDLCSASLRREEDLRLQNEVRSEGALSLYSALSWRRLDPIQLAYNLCRPDGWLVLTASAFNRLQPVCHQSLSQGPLLRRTRRFFASSG